MVNINLFKIYYLLPIFLITGPAISDILVTLSSFFFIIYLYKKKISFNINKKFLFGISFFFFILFISSVFSDNILNSLKYTLSYSRFFIFSFFIFYLLEKKVLDVKFYYFVLVFIILVLSFDAIYQFYFGYNIVGLKSPLSYRITSFFGREAILGGYVFKILLLAIFLNEFLEFKYKNYIFMILLVFSSITITISGDRSATYSLIILLIGLFFFREKKIYKYISLLVILIISIFIANSDVLKNRQIYMTIQGFFGNLNDFSQEKIVNKIDFHIKKEDKYLNFLSKDHQGHLILAKAIIKDNFFFGSGPNSFRVACNKEKYKNLKKGVCSTHPHNFYLQIFSELGFFAFLLLICFYIFILKNYIMYFFNKKTSSKIYIINLNILIILLPILPNGNFFNNWLSIINFLPFGFYFYYLKDKIIFFK